MENGVLSSVIILLALSVICVYLFRRVQLPPILGYLTVGMVVGPNALSLVPSMHAIELLAEVGVVFLIFTIGLEFSLAQFLSMRRTILGLGGAQVVASTAAGGLIVWYLGLSWQGALVAGGAMALSSTALVIKQLNEQVEMQSRHGRNALGILLFQDVAVVPLLVVIPILANEAQTSLAVPLLIALGKGVVLFLIIFAVGHFFLRRVFYAVASLRSPEIFTLTALLVALTAAWLAELFGLSLALGAFLAGMMLGESEYRHQIEADIRPFRDVLLGLFFITIASQLSLIEVISQWQWVMLLVLGMVFGKGLLIMALTRFAGYETGVAVRTGLVLGQGGEFGFAIIALALNYSVLSSADAQAIIAAIIISMLIAPFIIRYNGNVAKKLFAFSYLQRRHKQTNEISAATHDLSNHIIICGFGHIGQNLASFLNTEGFDFVALDLDPVLIKEASEAGERVIYGDSTHGDILEACGLSRARAIVFTSSNVHVNEKSIRAARLGNARISIISRAIDDYHLETLEQAGADKVVPEAIEASMMLATYLLQHLHVPMAEVMSLIESARANHYQNLRCVFHGDESEKAELLKQNWLHTVVLLNSSFAVGKKIADMAMLENGVKVKALRRGSIRGESPDSSLILKAGDAVVIEGPSDKMDWAEKYLQNG